MPQPPREDAFEEDRPQRKPARSKDGDSIRPPRREDDDRPEAPRRRPRDFDSRRDYEEDYEPPRRRRRRVEEDDAVSVLIPYKNGSALTAYYCGVFSLIPCLGLILGPIALIFGILGVRYVRAHPEAHGTGHAITGIVLGSLVTVVHVVVLGLMLYAALTHRR